MHPLAMDLHTKLENLAFLCVLSHFVFVCVYLITRLSYPATCIAHWTLWDAIRLVAQSSSMQSCRWQDMQAVTNSDKRSSPLLELLVNHHGSSTTLSLQQPKQASMPDNATCCAVQRIMRWSRLLTAVSSATGMQNVDKDKVTGALSFRRHLKGQLHERTGNSCSAVEEHAAFLSCCCTIESLSLTAG